MGAGAGRSGTGACALPRLLLSRPVGLLAQSPFPRAPQRIAADLRARNLDHVTLRLHFPDDYPNAPPFVHMLRPRLTEGTGYVLNGGGICMEVRVHGTPARALSWRARKPG